MRGDFSRWRRERQQNFNGVLHQQGRVLLDGDWNAQTNVTNNWQDIAGRDIIGAGVAAVPADEPDGFRVDAAAIVNVPGGEQVQLTVAPGRAWVDGLLVYLHGTPPVTRIATYLEPPVQDPAAEEGTINAGTRDAVVLEVWREEINGFQLPDILLEAALGGPDTTERVHTAAAFRLMRLAEGQTCESIIDELKDDFEDKGRLTASLVAPVIIAGDCPVAEGGGYTGFEHNLYRIEIAQTDNAAPMFKWSQFGGGLVGRGLFDAATKRLKITANAQAIANSGLQEFYLEALEYDPALAATPGLGHWRVTYGAEVTLGGDGQIVLPAAGLIGSIPSATGSVFFRLWNGIEEIADFTDAAPANALQDGILLQFDTPATGNYVAGDYWTFDVRAGDLPNDEILIDDAPPEGIEYHRAPLAVLNWQASSGQLAPQQIEDCRHIFRPLTRLAACCTFRVGDGVHSHGDFLTIQEAVDKLPATGGEVCVLPGVYTENVRVERRANVTIKGCGVRSRIVAAEPEEGDALPAIHVLDSEHVRVESLAIDAHEKGVGVLLEGPTRSELMLNEGKRLPLRDITLKGLHLSAATRSGVEAHVGQFITIRECRVEMRDEPTDWPGIFFVGEDSLIEDNEIRVNPRRLEGAGTAATGDPALSGIIFNAEAGRGGLQLGATCERVRVIDNHIEDGIGNGITLGSLQRVDSDGTVIVDYVPAPTDGTDNPCAPCGPGDTSVPPPSEIEDDRSTLIAGGALYDILIEHNRIYRMGLNGISSVGFFNLAETNELISVERLSIVFNEIRHCLRRPVAEISPAMINRIGYGGIALADADYLVVRDNFIEDNSPDPRSPVSGIFVLHGEGIEISRNRINNNGARPFRFDDAAQSARPGKRGGINIVYGLAPTVAVRFKEQHWPMQDGVPAVKVHENIVSAPLGQALVMTALGPVSVVGNQFTSRGVTTALGSTGFLAATVLIRNLGLSNELYFQLLSFAAVEQAKVTAPQATLTDSPTASQSGTRRDVRRLGRYLANGNVLFADNQCTLNLLEQGQTRALSSIAIFSLDDIGFHSNQCDCDLLDDFIISQALVFGISVRVSDNRFKEGFFNAILSAMTFGMLNATTDNQATHCLLIRGWPQLVVSNPNIILQTLTSRSLCDRFDQVLRDFGQERIENRVEQSDAK
ncbi:MAG TPA: DUF6519 domain-containing protein [Pyrinomonadaceae bacterium]|nr:DUF6519 domain-containing protein [Pyrinomonadaceae bacterium]